MLWGRTKAAPLLATCALFAGCPSATLRDGVYQKPGVRYDVGPLGAGWTRLKVEGNDLAFIAKGSEHTIAIDSTCAQEEDAPLEVLTQHLLMGFTDREQLSRDRLTMDGREALRSHYRAKLDGVEVELDLVVLKKDGCVYDFTYVSPPGRTEQHLADFDAILQRFHTEPVS